MLEHSVTKYDITERDPSGRFLQMSGLRVVYHLSQPEFERVSKVYVKCADCRVPHFKPLNETENYRLIVPKYIADGGDGYSVLTLNHTKRINSEDIDYQILLDYIKQKSPIAQALDNRIVVKVNNTLLWS
jgi:5'-nucleotidase